MSDTTTTQAATTSGTRYLRTGLILVIVVLAFVATYQIAGALGSDATTTSGPPAASGFVPAVAGSPTQGGAGSADCACCTNSGTGEPIEGSATVDGDVQRITVDTTNGYDPNTIRLAAGIPAEITFSQGSGCMAQVMSADLGFFEDLTAGPKTVSLPALEPGTYGFSCGMEMVFGEIIVE
ncbi:MAG: cupredoxin domain-containing protein [Coriobacteriia bacterium]|nr:cupredoxin domain-containing protein [Coriobacteriia bacterium]